MIVVIGCIFYIESLFVHQIFYDMLRHHKPSFKGITVVFNTPICLYQTDIHQVFHIIHKTIKKDIQYWTSFHLLVCL